MKNDSQSNLIKKIIFNTTSSVASGLLSIAGLGTTCVTPFMADNTETMTIGICSGLILYSSGISASIYFAEKARDNYRLFRN